MTLIDMAISNITQDNLLRSEEAKVKLLREALDNLLHIVDSSNGVVGWHMNGNVAEWDEFEDVEEARRILAETEGKP